MVPMYRLSNLLACDPCVVMKTTRFMKRLSIMLSDRSNDMGTTRLLLQLQSSTLHDRVVDDLMAVACTLSLNRFL
jgi:hypothetical protein